ncbi:germination protein YpeB [Neobacillus notoginsengisoli]|uniref:Germination protein YpeB n=1 Tax=Neobacillus notoginsengisoli TaxID=1578198 RepID=A0A417YVC9_9BACI|nr:germination protein YpeB [Neobacillus notoginsengisoli]RHW41230.1 germination protein YpeB [Neobacillus notoginsengisoli]
MIRNIIIGVLVLGIAGTAYWGYQEKKEKTAVLLNAENNYQQAFHDLTFQVDLLHDKLGTTLAMNSRKSLSPSLADVWRITSDARQDVGRLPLSLLPINKTEEFLSNVGNFSYKTAVRDLEKEPLSKKEYKALQNLYQQAADVQKDLRQVQHLALKNNLRWMDVELALAAGKENADNTLIDGFKTVEKTVSGYDKTDFGPGFTDLKVNDKNISKLTGKKITKNEAIATAKNYIGFDGNSEVKVTENGKGSDYGFYSVSISNKKANLEASMDITKKGGYPIWFLNNRPVKKQKLSLNEASNRALKFLGDNGYKSMELFESAQYDNIGVFTFVTKTGNVRIYPQSIKMKIALDNGLPVGLSADDYLKNYRKRDIKGASLSSQQARQKINPQVKIMEEREAVILNDSSQEVHCYEFLGTMGEDSYRIFINADSGEEEKVDKLKDAEEMFEDTL